MMLRAGRGIIKWRPQAPPLPNSLVHVSSTSRVVPREGELGAKRATPSPCRTGRCGGRTCKSSKVVVVEARANTELVMRCGTSERELVVETSATANRLVYMIFLCSCAFAIFGRSIGKAEASRRESRTDFARAGPVRQAKPTRTVVRHPFDDRAGWLPSARGARRCRGPTGNTGSKPGAGSMQHCQPPFKAYG